MAVQDPSIWFDSPQDPDTHFDSPRTKQRSSCVICDVPQIEQSATPTPTIQNQAIWPLGPVPGARGSPGQFCADTGPGSAAIGLGDDYIRGQMRRKTSFQLPGVRRGDSELQDSERGTTHCPLPSVHCPLPLC